MPEDATVLVPSLLRQYTDGRSELFLEMDGPCAVSDMLDTIAGAYPIFNRRVRDETGSLRRYVNVYVGGDDVRRQQGLATPVQPGQEVLIIQSVAGG
ncbi:MAG: thiamine biosynthesis protein ThiS [Micrococcaceae bacterium]|jgi:molybdopterin synthase sulfur carrier subunit|nr:thiamine biosynthesis protein ThiS [Micrococcaceae bacterium]